MDAMEYWSKMAVLLDIMHKAATAGPMYKWVFDEAAASLADMKGTMPAAPPMEAPDEQE